MPVLLCAGNTVCRSHRQWSQQVNDINAQSVGDSLQRIDGYVPFTRLDLRKKRLGNLGVGRQGVLRDATLQPKVSKVVCDALASAG